MTEFILNPETTCCFTGHREIPMEEYSAVRDAVDEKIQMLVSMGYTDFICGGALGFDTVAATAAIVMRRQYAKMGVDIRVHLYLPCHDQEKNWAPEHQSPYRAILANADSARYISEAYGYGVMHKRNRAMVDSSSCVVAYCKKLSGGTAYTANYALKHNKKLLLLPFGNLRANDILTWK